MFLLSTVALSAQVKSIVDCEKLAMCRDSLDNNVEFYYIPAQGALQRCDFTSKPSYLVFTDSKGTFLYDMRTMELVSEFKMNSDMAICQMSEQGYLVRTDASSNESDISYNDCMIEPVVIFRRYEGDYVSPSFFTGYGFVGAMFWAAGNTAELIQPTFFNYKGKRVWKNGNQMRLADREKDILLCSKKRNDNMFIAYRMSTGDLLWEREIPNKYHYPFCGSYYDAESDGEVYMLADSLVRLDLLTGKVMTHPFRAGAKESLKSRFNIGARMKRPPAYKELASELYYSGIYNNAITGMHSNWIVKGDTMFIADADSIYCFNRDLNTLWQTALPSEAGAKSKISIKGDRIQMLNYGVAFQDGYIFDYGKPFAAEYDISDGRQVSIIFPDIDKKIIGGCFVDGGRVYWQTDKAFYYTDGNDGPAVKIDCKLKRSDDYDSKCPDYAICDSVYVLRNGFLHCLVTDRNRLLVERFGKEICELTPDGKMNPLQDREVYFRIQKNVYSTIKADNGRTKYIVVNPDTDRMQYHTDIKGRLYQDENGNIIIVNKSGIGILPHRR